MRTHAWSAPASCPICLEDFNPPPTRNRPGAGPGGKDGAADFEAGGEGAGPGGNSYSAAPPDDSPSASLLVRGAGSEDGAGPSSGGLPGEAPAAGDEAGPGPSGGRGRAEAPACCGGVRRRSVGKAMGEEGGAGGGGGGGAADAGGKPERRAMTLACGHTFCEPCGWELAAGLLGSNIAALFAAGRHCRVGAGA